MRRVARHRVGVAAQRIAVAAAMGVGDEHVAGRQHEDMLRRVGFEIAVELAEIERQPPASPVRGDVGPGLDLHQTAAARIAAAQPVGRGVVDADGVHRHVDSRRPMGGRRDLRRHPAAPQAGPARIGGPAAIEVEQRIVRFDRFDVGHLAVRGVELASDIVAVGEGARPAALEVGTQQHGGEGPVAVVLAEDVVDEGGAGPAGHGVGAMRAAAGEHLVHRQRSRVHRRPTGMDHAVAHRGGEAGMMDRALLDGQVDLAQHAGVPRDVLAEQRVDHAVGASGGPGEGGVDEPRRFAAGAGEIEQKPVLPFLDPATDGVDALLMAVMVDMVFGVPIAVRKFQELAAEQNLRIGEGIVDRVAHRLDAVAGHERMQPFAGHVGGGDLDA